MRGENQRTVDPPSAAFLGSRRTVADRDERHGLGWGTGGRRFKSGRPDQFPNSLASGVLEGIVLKPPTSRYRDGTRAGWSKLKDPSWHEREAWRLQRRSQFLRHY